MTDRWGIPITMTDLNEHAQTVREQLPADVEVTLEDLTDRLEMLVNEYQVPMQEARRSVISEFQPDTAAERDETDPVVEHEATVRDLEQKLDRFKSDLRSHYTLHFDRLTADRCYVVLSEIGESREEADLYALVYSTDSELYHVVHVDTEEDSMDTGERSDASGFETYDDALDHLYDTVPSETRYFSEGPSSSDGTPVYVTDGRTKTELDTRRDLRTYSDGFAWGSTDDYDYGTNQLAVAILADYYDDETALAYANDFARLLAIRWDADEPFSLTGSRIEDSIEKFADPIAESVVVFGLPENEATTPYIEPTRYRAVEFVAVQAEELHVWHEGTHYIGVGVAEEVNEGDVFYYDRGLSGDGPPLVTEVIGIQEGSSGRRAEFDVGGPIHVGFIKGEPMQMAQLPPPTLLKEADEI